MSVVRNILLVHGEREDLFDFFLFSPNIFKTDDYNLLVQEEQKKHTTIFHKKEERIQPSKILFKQKMEENAMRFNTLYDISFLTKKFDKDYYFLHYIFSSKWSAPNDLIKIIATYYSNLIFTHRSYDLNHKIYEKTRFVGGYITKYNKMVI